MQFRFQYNATRQLEEDLDSNPRKRNETKNRIVMMNRKFIESDINFNSKRPSMARRSVGMRICWKNRWKPKWLAIVFLVFSNVMVTVTWCQELGESALNHPDRDFEHVAVENREIITNHIPTSENGGGGGAGGDDESRYKYDSVAGSERDVHYTEISGDVVLGEKHLRASDSPYSLRTDLEVERKARLIIEPGVTIYVAPMVGITVRGSLVALVSVGVSYLILSGA